MDSVVGVLAVPALRACPEGLQTQPRGFNPGNNHPPPRALKGRHIESTNNAEVGSNRSNVTRLASRNCKLSICATTDAKFIWHPVAPSGRNHYFRIPRVETLG